METNPSAIITTIVSTTLIIFISNIFIIYIIMLFKKKQLESHQELEVERLKLEKDKLKIELEIQEETLSFISREIHDNICLSLTLAKLHLNTYIMEENKNIDYINETIELLGKSILDLNDLSKSVDGEIITKFGLIHSIDQEICNGEIKYLNSSVELMIFRIIQEGINNILKHSKATTAKVRLFYEKEALIIEIIDDGIGFENRMPQNSSHRITSGFKNMEKRTKQINGNLEISSKINKGTRLHLNIPTIN
jgi:signal transduction histidine kinase